MNAGKGQLVQLYFKLDVSKEDVLKYTGPLSSYRRLNELFLLNQFTHDDYRKMLILELNGKQRPQVVRRLTQNVTRSSHAHLKTLVCQSIGRSVESLFGSKAE